MYDKSNVCVFPQINSYSDNPKVRGHLDMFSLTNIYI